MKRLGFGILTLVLLGIGGAVLWQTAPASKAEGAVQVIWKKQPVFIRQTPQKR